MVRRSLSKRTDDSWGDVPQLRFQKNGTCLDLIPRGFPVVWWLALHQVPDKDLIASCACLLDCIVQNPPRSTNERLSLQRLVFLRGLTDEEHPRITWTVPGNDLRPAL